MHRIKGCGIFKLGSLFMIRRRFPSVEEISFGDFPKRSSESGSPAPHMLVLHGARKSQWLGYPLIC